MTPQIQQLGIDRLSAEARLELIGEIWDSLSLNSLPIPQEHQEILDARLDSANLSPKTASPWNEVRAQF